jgi:hypothetical protein
MEPRSTDHSQGRRGNQGGDGPQGGAEHIYEQARDAMSGVADRASEMWDDVYVKESVIIEKAAVPSAISMGPHSLSRSWWERLAMPWPI